MNGSDITISHSSVIWTSNNHRLIDIELDFRGCALTKSNLSGKE